MEFECSICWEIMSDGQICATQCGHMFHDACLKTWIKRSDLPKNTKCPCCNHKLVNGNNQTGRGKFKSKKTKMTIAIKLPGKSSEVWPKVITSPGLSASFSNDELIVAAVESRNHIHSREQLRIRQDKLENNYKRLEEVYESRLLESRVLDAVNQSLVDERDRLKEKLKKAEASKVPASKKPKKGKRQGNRLKKGPKSKRARLTKK